MGVVAFDQLIDIFGLAFHRFPGGNFSRAGQSSLPFRGEIEVDQELRRHGMQEIFHHADAGNRR